MTKLQRHRPHPQRRARRASPGRPAIVEGVFPFGFKSPGCLCTRISVHRHGRTYVCPLLLYRGNTLLRTVSSGEPARARTHLCIIYSTAAAPPPLLGETSARATRRFQQTGSTHRQCLNLDDCLFISWTLKDEQKKN